MVNIIFESHKSVGLFVASLVLLTIGTVPLVVSTFSFVHMMYVRATTFKLFAVFFVNHSFRLRHSSSTRDQHIGRAIYIAFRIIFINVIGILATGAGLTPNPASYTAGQALLKAGYVLLGCIVAFLFAFVAYLWGLRERVETIYLKVCVAKLLTSKKIHANIV